MTNARARGRAVLAAAFALAACASPPQRLTAPKVVAALALAPYAVHEECIVLDSGERIGYLFRAAVPVAFDIHFRDGNAVIEPIASAHTRGESGEFAADRDQVYCLAWEAGALGSSLDYRIAPLRR